MKFIQNSILVCFLCILGSCFKSFEEKVQDLPRDQGIVSIPLLEITYIEEFMGGELPLIYRALLIKELKTFLGSNLDIYTLDDFESICRLVEVYKLYEVSRHFQGYYELNKLKFEEFQRINKLAIKTLSFLENS